jgi:Holliday junction resolvase RusA-like endonuclease
MRYFSDDSQVVNLLVTKEYADIFDEGMRIVTKVL